jgi:hypothetical protein
MLANNICFVSTQIIFNRIAIHCDMYMDVFVTPVVIYQDNKIKELELKIDLRLLPSEPSVCPDRIYSS